MIIWIRTVSYTHLDVYKRQGAQLAGKDGAALRTDVFVVAINAGMTTKQLGMADLIYSPPYAGVWDAVQIACNAARDVYQRQEVPGFRTSDGGQSFMGLKPYGRGRESKQK